MNENRARTNFHSCIASEGAPSYEQKAAAKQRKAPKGAVSTAKLCANGRGLNVTRAEPSQAQPSPKPPQSPYPYHNTYIAPADHQISR